MNNLNQPYIFGNTFTSVEDVQTCFYGVILDGAEPTSNVNTLGSDMYLILSEKTWRQGMINHIIIRNDYGASQYAIHLQAYNSVHGSLSQKAKALQTALNFKTVGSSAILKFVKCGNGTSPVTINGTQIMGENMKYAMVLIQASNVTSGSEANDITVIMSGAGQIQKTLTITGTNAVNYGGTVSLLGTPSGFNDTHTYQWYLNSQPIPGATTPLLSEYEITSGMISPLSFVLKATENAVVTTSNAVSVFINMRSIAITTKSTAVIGETFQLSITGTSTGFNGTPTYQWFLNAQPIIGATGPTYSYQVPSTPITPLAFVLKATEAGVTTSSNVTTVTIPARSVTLTRASSANIGDTINFSVATTGFSGGQTYQWYLDSEAIVGKTTSTLDYQVPVEKVGQSLAFALEATEAGVTTTSNSVTIAVNTRAISITGTTSVKIGETITLSATGVTGFSSMPIYQWYINGVADVLYRNVTIQYPITSDDPLSFELRGTEAGVTTTSNSISAVIQSRSLSIVYSGASTLNIGAFISVTGTSSGFIGTPIYQWYLNTQPISGKTSLSLSDYQISSGITSEFVLALKATESGITTTSNSVTIAVNTPSVTLTGNSSRTLNVEQQVNLDATVTNISNPIYAWIRRAIVDGIAGSWSSPLSSVKNYIFTIPFGEMGNQYEYQLIVNDIVSSNVVTLIINPSYISVTGGNKTVDVNEAFTLTAIEPVNVGTITQYQWQRFDAGEWVNLNAQFGISYIRRTQNTDASQTYQYRVTVLNSNNQQTASNPVFISVSEVNVQLQGGRNALVGETVEFTASSTGIQNPVYRWWRFDYDSEMETISNPTLISEATTAIYHFEVPSAFNNKKYRYKVNLTDSHLDDTGSFDSNFITLTVADASG